MRKEREESDPIDHPDDTVSHPSDVEVQQVTEF